MSTVAARFAKRHRFQTGAGHENGLCLPELRNGPWNFPLRRFRPASRYPAQVPLQWHTPRRPFAIEESKKKAARAGGPQPDGCRGRLLHGDDDGKHAKPSIKAD